MSKQIVQPRDLENFGIYLLTGEADRTFTRILCDLDRRGLKIFCTAFGLKLPSYSTPDLAKWVRNTGVFNENWNGGTLDYPHVASVMLSHTEFRQLAFFALYLDGAETIVTTESAGVMGFYKEDEERRGSEHLQKYLEEIRKHYGIINCVHGTSQNVLEDEDGRLIAVCDRNVHQFSGRSQ